MTHNRQLFERPLSCTWKGVARQMLSSSAVLATVWWAAQGMERTMASWSDFHTDPRKSYYLFLRQEYQHTACAAHARVKRIDRMIAELTVPAHAPSLKWSVRELLGFMRAAAKRLWEHMHHGRSVAGGGAH